MSQHPALDRLLDIVAQLRGPDGCPWDREQTLKSLKPYLIEEAYEVIDAIDNGDVAHHREELGDLLFEGVHACGLFLQGGDPVFHVDFF